MIDILNINKIVNKIINKFFNKNMTQAKKVYSQIKEAILYGDFSPGEKLVQLDLVKRFGASRLHIRDALNKLNAEGLVKLIPNKGALVKNLDNKEVEETFGILACLESYAAELGISCCDHELIGKMRKLNQSMWKNIQNDNFLDYIKKNIEFHVALAKQCGNTKLADLILNLRERNNLYTARALLISKHKEEIIQKHNLIIGAIAQKDLKKTKKYLSDHINRVKNTMVSYLRKNAQRRFFPTF